MAAAGGGIKRRVDDEWSLHDAMPPLRLRPEFTVAAARPAAPAVTDESADLTFATHPRAFSEPPLPMASRLKRAEVIVFRGREGIDKQQPIVTTAMSPIGLHRARSATPPHEMVAPLGTPADHDVLEGDLVMIEYRPGAGKRHGGFLPEGTAFACVNGLTRRTAAYPLGVAVTSTKVEPGKEGARTLTVQVGGTCTIAHMGATGIKRWSRVAVSPIPATLSVSGGRDGKLETVVPYVRHTGYPATRFVPAIFEFHDLTVASHAASVRAEVSVAVMKAAQAAHDTPTVANFEAMIAAGADAVRAKMAADRYDATYQPIELYGRWYALELCMRMAALLGWAKTEGPDRLSEYVTRIQQAAQEIRSKEAMHYAFETQQKMYDAAALDESRNVLWAEAMKPVTHATPLGDLIAALCVRLPDIATEHMANALAQQHEWCDRWVIGRALSSAEPGESLDILLGAKGA